MSNKSGVRSVMRAAAQRAVASTEALPLDDEVRKLSKRRRGLRDGLVLADAIRLARSSLVMAVERGLAQQTVAPSQKSALAQWKSLSVAAKKAVTSLDNLTNIPKFTIANLQVLCTKQNVRTADFSGSSTAALRAVRRGANDAAAELRSSIIAARQAANTIADQANAMAKGVAKRKYARGKPFRRGYTIEMMKIWSLLTGRLPSSKRSEVDNPFVSFADAGLQSIHQTDLPSCAGVIRSAREEFLELHKQGAFDDTVPDEIYVPVNKTAGVAP